MSVLSSGSSSACGTVYGLLSPSGVVSLPSMAARARAAPVNLYNFILQALHDAYFSLCLSSTAQVSDPVHLLPYSDHEWLRSCTQRLSAWAVTESASSCLHALPCMDRLTAWAA